MTTAQCDTARSSYRKTGNAIGARDLTDKELLDRFILLREEAAFDALLERHGPLVLGVCRRILHDVHDADDAFQATFLVLVRKVASIAKRQSLGSWLYGVAYRIALKAKTRAHQRRAHERNAVNPPTRDPLEEVLWRDLRPVLDEEVNRLPEKYRAPVVLCYLEGMSYAETARQLECCKGAVALRLEQARDRLRERLRRRGLDLSVAMLPALLKRQRVTVSVPAALGEATARAAWLWVVGGNMANAVPAPVAALADTASSGLAWTKWKIAGAVLLAAIVAVGAGEAVFYVAVAERPAAADNKSAAPKKGRKTLDDRLDGLPRRP
jgi:RNA polymerase sigma factor (sigma-70 family)